MAGSPQQERDRELRAEMESLFQGDLLREQGFEVGASPLGGSGLFATRAMPCGAQVRIPRMLVLDAAAAAATELGGMLRERGIVGQEALVAVLADARCRPDASPYGPYASRIPLEAPDAASWRPDERGLLQGTDLGAALSGLETDLVDFGGRLGLALKDAEWGEIPLESIRWARGMLLSRRFPAMDGGGGAGQEDEGTWGVPGTLVPFMDFMNHSGQEVVMMHVLEDGQGGMVVTQTQTLVQAGQEVFNNYGITKSNEELLAMYGFAVPNNPADAIALMFAREGTLPVRCFIGREGLSEDMWGALMGDEELEDEEEVALIAALREALVAKLQALDREEPSDEQYAAAGGGRGRFVRMYRGGVREVLQGAIEECHMMMMS